MARDLDIVYGYKPRPTTLLNSLFMSTLNVAAKTLVSVASNIKAEEHSGQWRPSDHLRFMVMLMTWMTVWVLRVLMDHFPCPLTLSPHKLIGSLSSVRSFALGLPAPLSSSSLPSTTSHVSSMDLIELQEDFDGPSVQGLSRALTRILALLNEIPGSSRKYQFAMAMAEKIMDGNFRDGHVELVQVNRTALSSAFARTANLLHRSLQYLQASFAADDIYGSAWTWSLIRAVPLGSYILSYVKGFNSCVGAVLRTVGGRGSSWQLERRQQQPAAGGYGEDGYRDDVVAEKLAQELLWITLKLRDYGAVDEALVQWSFASGLAALALTTANSRVQGLIVKISAILIGDLNGEYIEVSTQVKFSLLILWIPLFCHAHNGLSYPVLSSFEKFEVERAMDDVLSTLPAMDQEVVLSNWLQDFAVSATDWPNLQSAYDRWCQSTRALVA